MRCLLGFLPLNTVSTFQSANDLASVDWPFINQTGKHLNLTLVGSADSFLSLLLSMRLLLLSPRQLLPSLFLLLLFLLWLCPMLLTLCRVPNSDRYGNKMIADTEIPSEGSLTMQETESCSSHLDWAPGGESRSCGYIWHSGWWTENLIIKSHCEFSVWKEWDWSCPFRGWIRGIYDSSNATVIFLLVYSHLD